MEANYRLAKKAYEDDLREIVNCTVGGKLELFRRAKLEDELRSSIKYTILSSFNETNEQERQKKEKAILNNTSQRILKYRNKHKGERCVIIGNGSSLNDMDLSFLKNEICFGLNRIYLGFQAFDFIPTYYVAVNELIIKQSKNEISQIACTKFISNRGMKYLQPQEDLIFIKTNPYSGPDFSTDLVQGCKEGGSVTYVAMQLAYYMGFESIILIGLDHNFGKVGIPNQEFVCLESYPNHFHPNYFTSAEKWQFPDLVDIERHYKIAQTYFYLGNKNILNATFMSRCHIFKKVSYQDFL